MIVINSKLSIPDDEIRFTFSRSSGPGGQNVNKLNSRAILWFDMANSPSLSSYRKFKIRQHLARRISKDGVLQVAAERHRTQKANKEDALQRFSELLAAALVEKPRRKKTRIGAGVKERRLQAKKHRGQLKTSRSKKNWK